MKNRPWLVLGVKIIAFLALIVIIDWVIGKSFDVLEDRIYAKDPQLEPTNYMVKDLESDIVIVGASTASRHYIPSMIEDSLNMSAYNCGFDGTPFVVQNALLNLMLDRYTPKVIIWEMEGLEMEEDKEIQFLYYLYPYYDSDARVRVAVDGKDRYQRFRMLSKTYRHNSKILTELNDLFSTELRATQLTLKGYKPLDDKGDHYPTRIHKAYGNTLDTNYVTMLENTIVRCKESGMTLVLTTSPRFINDYDEIESTPSYTTIVQVAQKYSIPHLDFFELYSNDSTLFYDNAHLNDNGTRQYMGVFIPALKEIIIY